MMAVETLANTYTSEAEIQRIAYGAAGADALADDLSTTDDATLWTEVVEDATDFVNQYALRMYEAADMADNRWVRSRATWIAAHLFSQRRGNPSLFSERFEQIKQELIDVAEGRMTIPRLTPRDDFTPAMSNLTVDPHFSIQKVRVVPSISTGGSSGRQHVAYYYPYEWL